MCIISSNACEIFFQALAKEYYVDKYKREVAFVSLKLISLLGIGNLTSLHPGAGGDSDEHKVGHMYQSSYELELCGNNSFSFHLA